MKQNDDPDDETEHIVKSMVDSKIEYFDLFISMEISQYCVDDWQSDFYYIYFQNSLLFE